MKTWMALLLTFLLLGSNVLAQTSNPNLVCDQRLLNELDQLFQDYLCLKLDNGKCASIDSQPEAPQRRKLSSRELRKASAGQMRKISDFVRKSSITSVNGAASAIKYVFRKVGGFYFDSVMNADPTADACKSEEHPYKTKAGDTVDVSKYIQVGVPSGSYKCEMAFNLEGNNGVGNFYDLPSDQERLKVLKNKKVCAYYYGIREHLEDEIFKNQPGATTKLKNSRAVR